MLDFATDADRIYTPNPSTRPLHDSNARVKALMGAVGSGKSLAWMMHFLKRCMEYTVPFRGIVIRQSWPELRDSTKVTWERWLGAVSEWRQIDHQMRVTVEGFDGVVRTHSMDFRHAKRAADASRFLSTEYGMIVLEECVPAFDPGRGIIGGGLPKEIFDVALMRLRQPDIAHPELWSVFNPPPKTHWCFKEFIGPMDTEQGRRDLLRKSYHVVCQPAFENQRHLPPGYYESLLELLSPELAERFVYGKPISVYPGQPVYPEFLEDYHVVPTLAPLRGVGVITGHDFGRTPAGIIAQVTPEGQLRCLKEIQLWGASTETFGEVLSQTLRTEFPDNPWLRGWGDPAGQNPTETDDRTSFMILAAKGYPLNPGAMTLAARLEAVKQRASRAFQREPGIVISQEGCPMLSDAVLGGYRYPKSLDGQVGWVPLKNDYSHIANCLEYMASGEFSVFTGSREYSDPAVRVRQALRPRLRPLDPVRGGDDETWMSS